MKKFKFRLQTVLEAREKELEDRQLEMAIIQNKLIEQQKQLNLIIQNCLNTKSNLESLLGDGVQIDIVIIKNHQDYIDKLKKDIFYQEKLIADTEVELEEKIKEVTEALKAKTMLEKLKEKEFAAFLKHFEKLEEKQIDEIAINRYTRNS